MFDFFQGEVNYYRIYDISSEVDLKKAEQILKRKNLAEQFRLRRASRSIIIEQNPVSLVIGEIPHNILGQTYRVQAMGKLWSVGALSITFKIIFDRPIPIDHFKLVAHAIQSDHGLEELALDTARKIVHDSAEAIKNPTIWDQFEDYTIFNFDTTALSSNDPLSFLSSDHFYQLIIDEPVNPISNQIKDIIKQGALQYAPDDLVILDWNSAFIYSRNEASDLCDVIEFGLCQLLEMRYYDDLLDKKLRSLYKSIQTGRNNIFSSNFSQLAKEAYSIFLEISDTKEKIENSLKVIGDFYYARIYRQSLEKLRLNDWQKSVKAKLDNLAEISQIFQGEVNQKRSQYMELVVIALIATEVIPLVFNLLKAK